MVVEVLLAVAAGMVMEVVYTFIEELWGARSEPKEIPLALQSEMSTYDEKMIGETQRLVESVFCQEGKSVVESVKEMSNLERIKKAEEFAKELAKLYGLDIEIDVTVAPPEMCGGYYWNNKKACFNLVELMMDANAPNFDKHIANFIDTVIHEERHAVQHQSILENGFWEIDEAHSRAWAGNMQEGNYIRPEVDVRGYRLQPIENDAFTFANLVMEGVTI